MIYNKIFKSYFNAYDTDGVLHSGFTQSMDLSAYVELTMLNDLSKAMVDGFLYNELSKRIVLKHWKNYLVWDSENKRFNIKPVFYTDAVAALYVYLVKQQKFFEVLTSDFRSLSANETEQINYGAKTTSKAYGAQTIQKDFDKVVIELSKGTETENRGTRSDSETLGGYTDGETIGARTDNETKGAEDETNTRTEKTFPYDANDFVNAAQTIEKRVTTPTTNSYATGAQSNSKAYGARANSKTTGAQENTKSFGKTTDETKERQDTETHAAHTDNESVAARIDTKTRTKVIVLSPEKYFEIQKELAEKNIYTLFSDAVKECFLTANYGEFQALENGGCIIWN